MTNISDGLFSALEAIERYKHTNMTCLAKYRQAKSTTADIK